MGVEGLPKILRDHSKKANKLTELKGGLLLIDGFVLMHRAFNSRSFARNFHQFPSIDMYPLVLTFTIIF